MTPTLLLVGALAAAGACAGSFFYGVGVGKDSIIAQEAKAEQLLTQAVDRVLVGTAEAINKIEVKHVTVKQQLQREVIEREVFRDCRSGPESVRLFNSTLQENTGTVGVAGEAPAIGSMPAANKTGK